MPYYGLQHSGGGGPGSAPRLAHRHQQALPAAVWTIAHGLGFRPAGVQVTDPSGTPVEGVVSHPDLLTTHITFGAPLAGTADLS